MDGCKQARARRSGAGRPRDPTKDDAILLAARDLFFERGFTGSTIEEIAQRANVSKVTVYKRFNDKETLFATCVRAEMARMASAFDPDTPLAGGLRERLNAFGTAWMGFLSRPQHVALDRVMAQEFVQMPALARRLFDAGPAQSLGRVAEVLGQASEAGVLDCPEPLRAAEDLFALWKGMMDVELKFGVRDHVSPEEIRRRVEHGTATFLRAYDGGKGACK